MNCRYKLFLLAIICFAMFGCATPQASQLEKPLGDPYIFVFQDESKVFSIAYHALGREVEQSLIKELNGPVKGFYAKDERWGSTTTYWVRLFAANGINSAGRNTYGYYAEVLVEGDKGTEQDSARKIFSDIEAVFGQQGQKVYVRNLARAQYRSEEVGDYKSGSYDFETAPRPAPRREATQAAPVAPLVDEPELAAPARGEYVPQVVEPAQSSPASAGARGTTTAPAQIGGASMADELLKLDELRQKGILSDEEFQRAKERVLNW